MRRLIALFMIAGLAANAGAQSWELALHGIEAGVIANAKRKPVKRPTLKDQPAPKAADKATWDALLAKARASKHRQRTQIGSVTYIEYILTNTAPLRGQDCPQGTTPENRFYLTETEQGETASRQIYPVRVSVVCRGDAGVHDSFDMDADYDGTILDIAVYDGALGLAMHPAPEMQDDAPSAEPTALKVFLTRAFKQFLETR